MLEKFDNEIILKYKESNYKSYPDSNDFISALDKCLLVLYITKSELKLEMLFSYQIKSILQKIYREPLTDRAISNALVRAGKKIKVVKGKLKSFEIMRTGEMVIELKAKQINKDIKDEPVIGINLFNVVKGTRGYIERPAEQADGCYDKKWYDACSVMIRRVIESLIIECFEAYGLQLKIKDANNNYFMLERLITEFLNEISWSAGRNTKQLLPKIKKLGDNAAHNRRYLAQPFEIDALKNDLIICIQELLYISKLKT